MMGDKLVTSRYLVRLFFTTLLVGGITTGIVGFIARWDEFEHIIVNFDLLELISVILWLIFYGFIFSILSQMGFFAYLTIHRFGLGIFKSAKLWNAVQVVLIVFVLFDLVYLRYKTFATNEESIISYFFYPLVILVIGLVAAYFKAKMSDRETFIPALFFMVVVTTIEWVPALRVNEEVYLMLFPLLLCNIYQLLILQKFNEKSLEERKNKPAK